MDAEDFRNIAAGIQSGMVVLAILAGGIWALFRFHAFREVEKARAELQTMERDLSERGALSLQLKASQFDTTHESAHVINVIATVKNVGERTEILNWNEGTLRVGLVTWQAGSTPVIGVPVSTTLLSTHGKWRSSSLRPQQQNIYPFLVKLDASGVYLIELDVKGSPEEMDTSAAEHEKAGIRPGAMTWSASMYYSVT